MPATLIREFAAQDARRISAVVAELLGLPEQLAARRDRLFREVAADRRVSELHAGREEYQRLYDDYIGSAERFQALAEAAGSPLAADLGRVAHAIREQRDELFRRWRTLDDLYQYIGDSVAIPPEKWPALAAKFAPPQWWYDETADPFVAD